MTSEICTVKRMYREKGQEWKRDVNTGIQKMRLDYQVR
jgi:hypothetical protein